MNTPLPLNLVTSDRLRSIAIALGLMVALTGSANAKPGNGNANNNGKGRGNSPDFVPPGQGGVPPGLADKGVPPGLRRAPIEFVVLKAPPPLRIEPTLPRPSVKHVWVPGFWTWQSDAYVWAPGAWMIPPEPNAVWVTPRFEKRSGGNVFISGFWRL